jgi:putative transcriptional regulator
MADRLVNTLKAARTRLGWTQADLAVRVSVSRKTINTVENGVFTPSVTLALRLAAALGEPVEALFLLERQEQGSGQGPGV